MSGIGAKLSRHVLGMKFMKKTKAEVDKKKERDYTKTEGQILKTEAGTSCGIKNESPSSLIPTLTVEELWSYNQCERYIFGRQSFGGFNPTVEKNVKKGIWKPFYLEDVNSNDESSDEEDKTKKIQSDVDISDEEMAKSKSLGSLVGTLGKYWKKKQKQDSAGTSKKGGHAENRGRDEKTQKPKWHKGFKKMNSSDKGQRTKPNLKRHDQRPQGSEESPVPKRRKFLKPSDD